MADPAALHIDAYEETPFHKIRKRDGRVVLFEPAKITDAIFCGPGCQMQQPTLRKPDLAGARYLQVAGYNELLPPWRVRMP